MSYVYIKSEENLYTIGFYDPQGKWIPEGDYSNPDHAAERVHYLNGGSTTEPIMCSDDQITALKQERDELKAAMLDFIFAKASYIGFEGYEIVATPSAIRQEMKK